jgi:hypothetical protein
MSAIAIQDRPKEYAIIAALAVKGINQGNMQALVNIGRGFYLLYPKGKEALLQEGTIQIDGQEIKVTKPPPITKMLEKKYTDVYISNYPYELPLETFKVGFEARLGIKIIEMRKDTYRAAPGIENGKIVVKIDIKESEKIPEFFKVNGLVVRTWYPGCIKVRPCTNCKQTGHPHWECRQHNQTNSLEQAQKKRDERRPCHIRTGTSKTSRTKSNTHNTGKH